MANKYRLNELSTQPPPPPLQISELETEFDKMAGERAVQTRYLRSQQELKQKREAAGEEEEEEEGEWMWWGRRVSGGALWGRMVSGGVLCESLDNYENWDMTG